MFHVGGKRGIDGLPVITPLEVLNISE